MPLPPMPGWLVDYPTAAHVMDGGDALLHDQFAILCATGMLKYCFCEEESFKGNPATKQLFWTDQKCRCPMNQAVYERAVALPDAINGRKSHPNDHSAKMITASALANNYGIISNKTTIYLTPIDYAMHHGVFFLTLEQFRLAVA